MRMRFVKGILSTFKTIARCLTVALAATTVTAAYGQNPAVNFVSSGTVSNLEGLSGATSAIAGHFDRDKYLDFFFVGDNAPFLSYDDLVHNNQNGTFSVTMNGGGFSFGETAPAIGADFDGDGITDLLVDNQGFGGFMVQYGGTPGVSRNYTVDTAGSGVTYAASGDFNGDGKMDVAVLTTANKLVILLNQGSRNFHPAFSYALPPAPAGSTATSLFVGDLDGNGRQDLVLIYAGSAATATSYLSSTSGALTKVGTFSVGANVSGSLLIPVSAAIGDLNKDGYGDLAVITSTGVKVLLGSSTGALHSGVSIVSAGAGCGESGGIPIPERSCLVLADFNKDGKLDLAIAGALPAGGTPYGPGYLKQYIGDGNGGFASPFVYSGFQSTTTLLAGDINGTGNTDLVTQNGGSLNFFRNNGTGHLIAAPITISPNATGMVAGDFNRDGKQDIAVVNTPLCKAPCQGTVTVSPGSGTNYFNPPKKYAIGTHGAAIAAGDLNGDHILDLVVTNTSPGDTADISVLLGNADGTFRAAENFTLGSLSNDAVLVDVNKDGKLDLVEDGGVALGKGDGSFGALIPFPVGLKYSTTAHLAVGDFNGDGRPDVVFATTESTCTNDVRILLSNGNGKFTAGQDMRSGPDNPGEKIMSVTTGRLRSGGPVDIAYSLGGICGISSGRQFFSGAGALLGNGDGTFTSGQGGGGIQGNDYQLIATGPVLIADLNHDGKMDLGVGAQDGRFLVATGKGDGSFFGQIVFTASDNPENFVPPPGSTMPFVVANAVVAADFTGDGRLDVMLTSAQGIARLYNVAVPTVSPGALRFTQPATSKTVTVTNTLSTAQVIGVSIASSATSSFKVSSNSCHGAIAPGKSCSVTVAYNPDANLPLTSLLVTDNFSEIAVIPLSAF